MDKEVNSLKKATIINAIGKYSKVLLGIIVEVVLARLLTPHDYGIVAVITVFTTFFMVLSDMGLGTAVIQRKDLTKYDIDQLYTFSVYIAFILAIVFYIFSFVISSFYENVIYIRIGHLLSISLFFNTLNMVPNGVLNRQKLFVTIAIRTLVVYTIAAIITIIVAYLGARYYALVFQTILTSILTFFWNIKTTKLKFKIKYDNRPLKSVANYSGFQFAFNLLNYFSRNLDSLLAGRFIGSTLLGYYNKAYTLMQYPISNLTGVITPVLHPILSDYQNNKDILYEKYMQVVKLLTAVGIWAEAICIFAGSEIIYIMYGNKWNNSVICFQLLAISIATQMINSSSGAAFQALSNTRLLFIQGILNTFITVVAIIVGVFYGKTIYALALYVSLSFLANFIVSFFFLVHFAFEKKFLIFLREMSPYIFVGVVVSFSCIIYPAHFNNIVLSLIFKLIYVTIVYLIALTLSGQTKLVFKLIFK